MSVRRQLDLLQKRHEEENRQGGGGPKGGEGGTKKLDTCILPNGIRKGRENKFVDRE